MNGIQGIEKRRFIRIFSNIPAKVILKNGKELNGLVTDISIDGVRVTLLKNVIQGEEVLVSFKIEDLQIKCKAKVVHSTDKIPKTYGLKFLNLDRKKLFKLGEVIITERKKQDKLLRNMSR